LTCRLLEKKAIEFAYQSAITNCINMLKEIQREYVNIKSKNTDTGNSDNQKETDLQDPFTINSNPPSGSQNNVNSQETKISNSSQHDNSDPNYFEEVWEEDFRPVSLKHEEHLAIAFMVVIKQAYEIGQREYNQLEQLDLTMKKIDGINRFALFNTAVLCFHNYV